MFNFIQKIFGLVNDCYLWCKCVDLEQIVSFELKFKKLSDEEFKVQIVCFKEKFDQGVLFDDIMYEVFVIVCEVGRCVFDMCYYDVQMIGGMVIYEGQIVEMCIGEGKMFVVMSLFYFNVFFGKGVYLVMVNDYFVSCDVEWMGCFYNFFGFFVGMIIFDILDVECCYVYCCDIIYGINNEFGFDYLCDNMKYSLDDYVQCFLNFVIIDEVDLIFIDEVCMLLIISGQVDFFFV